MLIPVCCFSCGAPIAHLWENYKYLVKMYSIYLSNNNADDVYRQINEDKNKLTENDLIYSLVVNILTKQDLFNGRILARQNVKNLPPPSAEEFALIYLGINRMCCRRMFLTQADTYNLMNSKK